MKDKLLNTKNEAISMILSTQDLKELEQIRIRLLGRNGTLNTLLKGIVDLPDNEKRGAGKMINEVKNIIENAIADKESGIRNQESGAQREIDVTEPGIRPALGHLHLVTQAIEEITDIFGKIGFTRVAYPEVEWDHYAFTALNFPENHPARDDWETFFIDQEPDSKYGSVVLTPHTSSGQVREMEAQNQKSTRSASSGQEVKSHANTASRQKSDKNDLNIRMLNIAKCYRRQSDVSHTQMFHQFEGLVVGRDIAITHLKGVLDYFVKSYFGDKRISRIRPYHFQFTEPSFEVDVSCGLCEGTGKLKNNASCRLCKEGWLELGGAGMVHPDVMKYGGIDAKGNSGFAFGWGIERVLMMKEGLVIDDLRLLYSNKLDFLEQF